MDTASCLGLGSENRYQPTAAAAAAAAAYTE